MASFFNASVYLFVCFITKYGYSNDVNHFLGILALLKKQLRYS